MFVKLSRRSYAKLDLILLILDKEVWCKEVHDATHSLKRGGYWSKFYDSHGVYWEENLWFTEVKVIVDFMWIGVESKDMMEIKAKPFELSLDAGPLPLSLSSSTAFYIRLLHQSHHHCFWYSSKGVDKESKMLLYI